MYHRERREKGGNNKDIKELKQEKKLWKSLERDGVMDTRLFRFFSV